MIRLYIILLFLLMNGCEGLAGEGVPAVACGPQHGWGCPPPRDGICEHPAVVPEGTYWRYEGDPDSRAYEKRCLIHTKSSADRRGDILRLRLGNGTARTYKDSWSKKACEQPGRPCESCKSYVLYDYFPDHEFFLVHVGYYESDEWLLIRQLNGKEEKIVAPPRYSPNRKWLASVYWTEGTDDGNNGVDIVSTSANGAGRSFHYRPKDYELWEFEGWHGDDRLSLTVTWHVGDKPEQVTWPAEVVRVHDDWQLNRWAPASAK